MKTKFILFAVATSVSIFLFSCKKETATGLVLQSHDDNRMMDSMHVMMGQMNMMNMTKDPEIDFAKMMILHHQGAINMSQAEISAGTNDSLKTFAQKVINKQRAEIIQLQDILSGLTVDNMDMEYNMEQMANMEKSGRTADVQLITGDIDNDYATLMLIHHQSAIDDASGYLHHGNNAQLKTIATTIVSDQTIEIQELANWLKANKR